MAWKNNPDRKPLIIKGARQIGKTRSIEWFASQNYKTVIQINFVEQPKYKNIFEDGFEVDAILKNISLLNPELKFIPGKTLFFFDELQACPNCATSLKFFKLDGRPGHSNPVQMVVPRCIIYQKCIDTVHHRPLLR